MAHLERIGIIGCGFSGLLTLHHLVRASRQPLLIHVYEQQGSFGKGLAYSTNDPVHLLNVPAGRMGALPGRPDGFYRWLCRRQPAWKSLHASFAGISPTSESFLPRMVYGVYLEHILQRTLKLAHRYGHRIELIPRAVHGVDRNLTIRDASGEAWRADRIVLATGHPGVKRSSFQHLDDNLSVLRDPWNPRSGNSFWHWFEKQTWRAHSQVVVLGTGLSAVDMLHSLRSRQFPGRITAVSRHGLLPKPHKLRIKHLPHPDLLEFPRTALGLAQKLNRDIDRLNLEGRDWRITIDQIRPIINAVWDRLPLNEQRQFLRDHFSWWNVLRHRMTPQSYALVEEMFASGKFQVRSGKVLHVGREGRSTQLYVQSSSEDTPACLNADAVIDCRGFTCDLSESGNEFLLALRQEDMIGFSPLRTGVPTDGNHRAQGGQTAGRLYVLGPLLFGERLETTAVPELRQQAQNVAALVLDDLQRCAGKDRAKLRYWSASPGCGNLVQPGALHGW